MKKVIVFGGSGFLGSHVADALSDAGYEVAIYDLNESSHLRPDQKMIIGNILDAGKVAEAVAGCDYVYNFAGIADLDTATTQPLETVVQNIQGTVNLLEAATARGLTYQAAKKRRQRAETAIRNLIPGSPAGPSTLPGRRS